MAVAIDKEMRQRAKQDSKYLFQISLDPRQLSEEAKAKIRGKAPTGFQWAMSGPMPPECAVQLWKLFLKWQKAELI